jgi:hypothetical protein
VNASFAVVFFALVMAGWFRLSGKSGAGWLIYHGCCFAAGIAVADWLLP